MLFGDPIGRRQLLAAGCYVILAERCRTASTLGRQSGLSAASVIDRATSTAFACANAHFYDAQAQAIRPTNGGGPFARNGLIDNRVANPALWQRECFANVIINEWKRTGNDLIRRQMLYDWKSAKLHYTPGQLIGMADGSPPFRIVTTFDDACFLCSYLMHAHMAGAEDALGYLVEAIAYNTARFADPDRAANPLVTFVERTPNFPRIDFNLGTASPSMQSMTASRFGSLYALPDAGNYTGGYGKCSSAFEAHMGLAALYVYDRLGYAWMRDYAVHAQKLVETHLLTPDPQITPADSAHTPLEPCARKARYLVETELCLSSAVPSNDPYPAVHQPRNQWYGKPVRGLDSTYLGGALAYCVLSARLHRRGLGEAYRHATLNTASAIISQQGYGRAIMGRTLIANTRDPHSEGHWAVPFVAEVLALRDVSSSIRAAFVDTGCHIAHHCLTPDGYVTAEWAGSERNPATGRSTWDEEYIARPGSQAGHVQIMTTMQSLAMLQACGLAARQGTRSRHTSARSA